MILFTAIGFVSVGTLISGVLLTFTGSIDQITEQGMGVLFSGIFIIFSIIIFLIFYPKWKFLLLDDENEEVEEEEGEETIEEVDEVE